jgi:hypothetical protein
MFRATKINADTGGAEGRTHNLDGSADDDDDDCGDEAFKEEADDDEADASATRPS